MGLKGTKIGNNDSISERNFYYNYLVPLAMANKISNVKRLDNKKDFTILQRGYNIIKNGKRRKIQSIKYTPDYTFFNINSNVFPCLPDNKFCYLEFKSKPLSKKPDYGIRKRLFIPFLKVNECFIEVIYDSNDRSKKYTINVYHGEL